MNVAFLLKIKSYENRFLKGATQTICHADLCQPTPKRDRNKLSQANVVCFYLKSPSNVFTGLVMYLLETPAISEHDL